MAEALAAVINQKFGNFVRKQGATVRCCGWSPSNCNAQTSRARKQSSTRHGLSCKVDSICPIARAGSSAQ